nr:MAG TPA: hypothetical protein [Caudoviricetes sp.]
MERKIGETFEYQGKTYKVAEFDDCRNCAFIHINCSSLRSITGNCMYFFRNDGANVKFEEVKDMKIKDNQLTINIPDGMEIDLQNSNFDTGVIKFKKKELTYEDIKASLKLNENMKGIDVAVENVNRLCAINRLMCIAKFYNGDWKPNWSSVVSKYCILYSNRAQCYITDYRTCFDSDTVYFKREKDAQAVIDNPNFREILDAIYKD